MLQKVISHMAYWIVGSEVRMCISVCLYVCIVWLLALQLAMTNPYLIHTLLRFSALMIMKPSKYNSHAAVVAVFLSASTHNFALVCYLLAAAVSDS